MLSLTQKGRHHTVIKTWKQSEVGRRVVLCVIEAKVCNFFYVKILYLIFRDHYKKAILGCLLCGTTEHSISTSTSDSTNGVCLGRGGGVYEETCLKQSPCFIFNCVVWRWWNKTKHFSSSLFLKFNWHVIISLSKWQDFFQITKSRFAFGIFKRTTDTELSREKSGKSLNTQSKERKGLVFFQSAWATGSCLWW